MTTPTFHSFCRLPWELREQIWALAIRPDRPAAHHFTIFNARKPDELSTLQSHAVGHQSPRYCDLAAPRSNKSDLETISWTASNPSMYLTDSGLWTACRESREVMERRFDTLSWRRKRLEVDYYSMPHRHFPDHRFDTPATGTFTSNGETQCFTVHPSIDLFFLQPYNFDTVDWADLLVRAPLFSWRFGFQLQHIAIEFDPKHDYSVPPMPTAPQPMLPEHYYIHDEYSQHVTDCFETAALSLYDDMHLWLIDTRLKRRPGIPLKEDGRHIFYTSSGRYVEVDWTDEAWGGTSSHNVDIGWGWTALPHLHGYLEEFCERNRHDVWAHQFGVLAYEAFD